MPTHNRADLVGRAIRSVLAQTMSDLELIVIYDGSDNTPEVLAAMEDSRLRVIRRATAGGPSPARNAGIAVARAEWVAFLDDDDEWLPRTLDVQLARLSEAPEASAVYCLSAVQTAGGVVPSPYAPPLPEGDMLRSVLTASHTIGSSARVVRRSALLQAGGFDETFRANEDCDLWLRLSLAGHITVAVPETLVIAHAEHKRRLTQDAAGLSRGFARYERRWLALAKQRLTPDEYADIGARHRRELERLHVRQIKRFLQKGDRKKARIYLRVMTPALPTYRWAFPYVWRAFAVAVLGPSAGRFVPLPERSAEMKARRKMQAEGVDSGK
jgi:glycosyltransferase involved in cell wall biosynthesis